jgi:RNA polymerase sigma-70 factor (ECF subfamily)
VDDERVLLQRLRAGDEDAFAGLVARHDPALRHVARSFVRTHAQVDDVVQETWLGVLRGLDGFEGRASLRTWIFRILVNRARSRAVREARDLPFSALARDDEPAVDPAEFTPDGAWASAPPRADVDPETQLLRAELRGQLLGIVLALPEAQRAVLALRDIAGLPPEEVCELLELSDGNQRVLLHRARSRVRMALVPIVGDAT